MKAQGHAIKRLIVPTILIGALALGVTGCDDRLARMEENQVRMQAMVAANARQIAMVSSQVYTGNNEVQDGIQKLDRNDQDLGVGVSTVQNQQDALHKTVTSASQAMDKRMATLDENQRLLRDGVSQVADVTRKTASDVTAIAGEQATLHQMVQSSRRELGESIAAVAVNQEKTRTDIGQLQQANQRLADQLVALAASQDRISGGLDSLSKFMQVVARDVTGISQGQTAMQQTLNEHKVAFAEKAALLEQNQRHTQTAVDGVAADTRKNTEGIAAIAAGQTAMQQTLAANHKIVAGQVAAVIQNQAGLQNNLSGLHQKADAIAGSVATVRTEQTGLRDTLKSGQEATKNDVMQLSSGQEQLLGDMDVLTATTGQTALDVIDMAAGQNSLMQNLQNHNAAVTGQIAELGSSQQQTQSSLDVVVATAGQTALDMIDLNQGQARLTQTVQQNRRELADRLAEIVRNQQQWAQRLDAAQANVQTVATSIAALEQHLTELQGSLQPRLDGLTSQFSANGQDRAQFETKANQEIQAIVDAVSQLRRDQASLADDMQQIQKRTQSQTMDIITAIQQLRQPPAEVKVSDSGTKLESSVAEAAAK